MYEWKTFFRTMVSIPPLLGQPYQIQPYGPPREDERLQMIAADDEGSGYVVVVVIYLIALLPKIDPQDEYLRSTS